MTAKAEVGSSAALPDDEIAVDAHGKFRARRHFGSLDGLRALSVVGVVWHHTAPSNDGTMPYLFKSGSHGVTLFFAISGFLIVTLLLRERERTGTIDLKAFYLRRCLRIFPLYYSVLAIYVLLVFLGERDQPAGREFFGNLPFFLTYTSNWFVLLEGRVIFYFAWSLAAEEQFYLVWPTIQKRLGSTLYLTLLIGVIVTVTAALLLLPVDTHTRPGLLQRVVTGIPLSICFGVLLAHALHNRRGFVALRLAFGNPASVLVWLAIFIATLSWRNVPLVLIHGAATMLVGACVYREDHLLAAVLQWRAVAYVGGISYGIYLLHGLVRNVVDRAAGFAHLELNAYATFLLTLFGSIGVAGLSYRYFESVFLRMKQRAVVPARVIAGRPERQFKFPRL